MVIYYEYCHQKPPYKTPTDLVAFTKESIDCLTIDEKLEILKADNMIKALTGYMNFDPNKPCNHNFFYEDIEQDIAVFYNGTEWVQKNLKLIIKVLGYIKQVNLMQIFEEIVPYLSDNDKLKISRKFKNELKLVKKYKMPLSMLDCDNLFQEPGYTEEDIKKNCIRDKQLKSMSRVLLANLARKKRISIEQKNYLNNFIDQVFDIAYLNVIICILGNALYLGTSVNNDLIIR